MWSLLLNAAVAGTGTVDVGLVHHQVRDDVVVPLRFGGGGLALGGGWRHDGAVHRGRVHLGLRPAALVNGRGHLSVTYAWALEGSWDAAVAELFGGELAVGADLRWTLDLYFHADWDDSHVYWLTVWGLGPRLAWRRPLGDQGLELWTSLPVLALASRPPARWETKVERALNPFFHLARGHSAARFTSLHQVVDLAGGATWSRPLPRGAMALTLSGRLATASWPERITNLTVVAAFERRLGRSP